MKYLSTLILLFSLFTAKASHIVGGDIYYDYLGGNNYRIYISFYRDCYSGAAAYDDPLFISIYTSQNQLVQNVGIPFPGSNLLTFNNPCISQIPSICVEKAIYSTVVNLPPTPGGYTISYQRCCRKDEIINIVAPEATGFTLTCHIPGTETGSMANSSPRFNNYPPLVLCANQNFFFDHSATDPDGDVLTYELCTPLHGGGQTQSPPDCFSCVAPNPASAPAYTPVTWLAPFSQNNPLGPASATSINLNTGLFNTTPTIIGVFVVGVKVNEYRSGVLINSTVRDFIFHVTSCTPPPIASLPPNDEICEGAPIQFDNLSSNSITYRWDFGVPGITTDISSVYEPTYTYTAPGNYIVSMITNPGYSCADTATMNVFVQNDLELSIDSEDSLCIIGNNFNFVGQANTPVGTTYLWNFGPLASIQSATTQNVNNVQFTGTGAIPITLSGQNNLCSDTVTESIFIFPEPTAEMELSPNYKCEGLTVTFGNNSTGATNYQWDFGIPGVTTDVSTQFEPTFTFPAGGTYTVTLIAGSNGNCTDTVTETITVNELLTISFTNNDSLCIVGNSFNFDGSMTGPSFTQYLWNFGPNASIQTSSDLDVSNVVFDTFGTFPITLTAWFDNCYETVTSSIFIFREPTINFIDVPGPRCAPAVVQFTELCEADSPIFYTWDFGDGTTSNLPNPSHIYTNPGTYNVSLGIYTTIGCIDTLFMMKQDLITIHPSPVSDFTVDPIQTDICHAEVTFTDQSQGASSVFYWFDDGDFVGNQASSGNHLYTYTTSGWHRPMQIATNQFGCTDTSYQELYIEPFIIFVPNTFTPDGNEFNNEFNAKFALEVYDWELRIYNRWGHLVYESLDYHFGWDGSFLGKLSQEGTYTYVIRYVSCEKPDSWQTLRGHVNLLK